MKQIIVNADDFGLTDTCTEAIVTAFDKGLITDTTMVANGTAFELAINKIQTHHLQEKIGVHFNLTECEPLTDDIKKYKTFVSDGLFHGKINRLKPLSGEEKKAVYDELSAQIQKLEDTGLIVTHADSHHHIHTGVFIAPIFAKVCKEHNIKKVRLHRNIGSISLIKRTVKKLFNFWLGLNGFITTKFFGSMEDINLCGLVDNLEIMVHPEYDKAGNLIDKVDEKNGNAIGEKLVLPHGDYLLKGYRNL